MLLGLIWSLVLRCVVSVLWLLSLCVIVCVVLGLRFLV